MQLNTLEDLFVERLGNIQDAERQLASSLPAMAQASSSADLHETLDDYVQLTGEHMSRIDRIFALVGFPPNSVGSEGMAGLIREEIAVVAGSGHPLVRDAGMIAAAQEMTHYQIAAYGSVRTYARELGYKEAGDLLQKSVDEEGRMDRRLTEIAAGGLLRTGINVQAPKK